MSQPSQEAPEKQEAGTSVAAKTKTLLSRFFLPLFTVQALGAFTDNAVKSAFGFLVVFQGAGVFGLKTSAALALSGAVFIIPFFLLSGLAGSLADYFDKARIVRWTRLSEIALALLAAISFYRESAEMTLVVLFLYAVQSTMFSPVKYSILPQHIHETRLISANAWIESSSFIAILFGTIFGGLAAGYGYYGLLAVMLFVCAVIGAITGFLVPSALPSKRRPMLRINPFSTTWYAVRLTAQTRVILLCVAGIAWFTGLGLVVLSVFPEMAKSLLDANQVVANILIAAFVIGIAIGAFLTQRLLKGRISWIYAPLGLLITAVFLIDLSIACSQIREDEAVGFATFVSLFQHWQGWRVMLDMVMIAVGGGMFTVPLHTIIQHTTRLSRRANTVAGTNVVSSGFMVLMSLGSTVALNYLIDPIELILLMGVVCLALALYLIYQQWRGQIALAQ